MLANLVNFEKKTTLIMQTGIQFMDFGIAMQSRKEPFGQFILSESNRTLTRLLYNEAQDTYYYPSENGARVTPRYEVSMEDTLKLLDGVWLPIPFLRSQSSNSFCEGPTTWSRARIVATSEQANMGQTTHRLTLAFDTNLFDDIEDMQYLAPTISDVESGESFGLSGPSNGMEWFVELIWVDAWLKEIFQENANKCLGLLPDDINEQLATFTHHGHYLNFLSLIEDKFKVPEIKILSNITPDKNVRTQQVNSIGVDLVLDIGNSRTCGILIESHPQGSDNLMNRYELMLRDLSHPEQCYTEPFESRLEFSQAILGKEHLACDAGRGNAFTWPTIARVGPEATRLASQRRGTEGSTGVSSPKRYLWDEERFEPGWRFNIAYDKSDIEPRATAAPFSNLINEIGEPLFRLPEDEQLPVFVPHYSRSSLMTFMLSEVLVQALTQINSPAQRLCQSHSNQPRRLNSITLTVPPSMPKPERVIFHRCMQDAVALVWKALGWHPEDAPITGEGADLAAPAFPTISAEWDEATCGQVVYLFSEAHNNFGGRLGEFFNVMRRPRDSSPQNERKLTIASIDIGGGTTDLVVTDYELDSGTDVNAYVKPVQRFRDGFKISGDDIVLEVVRTMIVPQLRAALREAGIPEPEPILSALIGSEPGSIQQKAHRRRIALQVLHPIALRILKSYETYEPSTGYQTNTLTIGELLSDVDEPSKEVLRYFTKKVRESSDQHEISFDLLSVPIPIDLDKLHALFMNDRMEICKTIRSLCEMVYLYHPDVLLLTGRPSSLPGIKHLVRALMPIPSDRIIPMHDYRCGTWYPFHKQGRISDPKTTAAVGAMLCILGQGRISRFFFRSNELKPYSTVRYIGMMDKNNTIKSNDVFYSEVDLDNEDYELPEEITFDVRGKIILGFRQLQAERWVASPLYEINIDEKALQKIYGNNSSSSSVLKVRLKKIPRSSGQRFTIASVESDDISGIGPKSVTIKLNTLNQFGLSGDSYWLDTGSIIA